MRGVAALAKILNQSFSARQSYNQRLIFTSRLVIVTSVGDAMSLCGELDTIGVIGDKAKQLETYSLIRCDIHFRSTSPKFSK